MMCATLVGWGCDLARADEAANPSIPTLAISEPTENPLFTKAAALEVTGQAADDKKVAKVQWQRAGESIWRAAVFTAKQNSWKVKIPLNIGSNVLSFRALDRDGNVSAFQTLTVSRSDDAPEISLTLPAADLQTEARSCFFAGTASDDIRVSKIEYRTSDDAKWKTIPCNAVGAWWKTMTLSPKTDVYQFRAVDSIGNVSATVTRTVARNDTRPFIQVRTPEGATWYVGKTFKVYGTAYDDKRVSCIQRRAYTTRAGVGTWSGWETVSPGSSSMVGSWNWKTTMPLKQSGEIVEFRAKDSVGNLSITVSRTVMAASPGSSSSGGDGGTSLSW